MKENVKCCPLPVAWRVEELKGTKKRKSNTAQTILLVVYVLFMAWVIVWKLNYHPAVYLPADAWWEHPGESANRTIAILEAVK